ncbi:MAG: hypothetical protein LBU40_02040 [Methanobrevibacter sp.]|jgi:hypothetical protein|nr:hypothetical protein [Methanobrevibacter sp.]
MELFEVTSNVINVRPDSSSLRTTLPKEVISTLKLKNKDLLKWNAYTKDDKLIIEVKKE